MSVVYSTYGEVKVAEWSTKDEGPMREYAFPYHALGRFGGATSDTPIRFGAFLGWENSGAISPPWSIGVSEAEGRGAGLLSIEHQAAGYVVAPWFCTAMPVRLRESMVPFAAGVAGDYYNAYTGYLWHYPEEIARVMQEYHARLAAAGLQGRRTLTGRFAVRPFLESIYPIEASEANLNVLLEAPDAALAALRPFTRDAAVREELTLFLIADNSD